MLLGFYKIKLPKELIKKDENFIWNFAIASNLHPVKRSERANLKIEKILPGKLKDWRLAFNLRGISWIEPSMASIEPESGNEVHGLLLKMSKLDFNKLVLSEGEDYVYKKEIVEVKTYDGKMINAIAFRTTNEHKLKKDIPPSLRYMNLIREGARLSNLDEKYINKLESMPYTKINSALKLISSLLIDSIMFLSRFGLPQIGNKFFRTLRNIDKSSIPRPIKFILNTTLIVPLLIISLLLKFKKNTKLRKIF